MKKLTLIQPDSDPAIKSAVEVSERVASVGFDWPRIEGILEKCAEELDELKNAIESDSREKILMEFGDILFALCNLGRHLRMDPETALNNATRRFIQRFRVVEERVRQSGRRWEDFTLKELDEFWETAKSLEGLKDG